MDKFLFDETMDIPEAHEAAAAQSGSERIKTIHSCVDRIKSSEIMG